MSETADLVRRALDAWNRRELEAVAELLTPDFEWLEHDEGPTNPGARNTGADAIREVTADLEEGFGEYVAEILEVVEVDAQRAVAVLRETGSGVTSGAPFTTDFGYVVTVRAGKVARVDVFRRPADAFAAVGR